MPNNRAGRLLRQTKARIYCLPRTIAPPDTQDTRRGWTEFRGPRTGGNEVPANALKTQAEAEPAYAKVLCAVGKHVTGIGKQPDHSGEPHFQAAPHLTKPKTRR